MPDPTEPTLDADRLRELLAKATSIHAKIPLALPWRDDGMNVVDFGGQAVVVPVCIDSYAEWAVAARQLIVAAVNALPTILATLAVAEAAREFHIGTHVLDWPCSICAALAALDQGGTAKGDDYEAKVEAAAQAFHGLGSWKVMSETARDRIRDGIRHAFNAAGVDRPSEIDSLRATLATERAEGERRGQLIEAQAAYIGLLGEECKRAAGIGVTHPHLAPPQASIDRGAELRAQIAALTPPPSPTEEA